MAKTTKNAAGKLDDDEAEARQDSLNGALFAAARDAEPEKATSCIAAGADPKARNDSGATALMLAAASGSSDTVKALIPLSDVNMQSNAGDTALLFAALFGEEDMVRALLESGANPRAVGELGRNALQWSIWRRQADTVALLAPKSDLDHLDDSGETAERMAEEEGVEAMIACLRQERALREQKALLRAVGDVLGSEQGAAPRKPLAL
jgi:uncharacterized protein